MVRDTRVRQDVRDEGFTLVEVVVAAAILFFVMTAVLGLVLATTQMSATAQERASITNLVSSRIDWIRGQPYAWISSANLPTETTTTPDGFTATITYTVVDKSTVNGTKEVEVAVVATKDGYPTITTSAFAAIRNIRKGMTEGGAQGENPVIEFDSPTPVQDSLVYDNVVDGAGLLTIRAVATAPLSNISRIEMRVDGIPGPIYLRDGVSGSANDALQDFGGTNSSESFDFVWHTRQIDATGNPAIADGYRFVKLIAIDDGGRQGFRLRRFFVDNHAPDVPGTPDETATPSGWTLSNKIWWGQAMDGTHAASKYEVVLWRDLNGEASLSNWSPTTLSPNPSAATSLVTPVQPLSRYLVTVRAGSPRATTSGSPFWSARAEEANALITRPLLQGTTTVTNTKKNGAHDWTFSSTFFIPPKPAWADGNTRFELYRARGTGPFALVANVTGSAGAVYTDVAPAETGLGTSDAPEPYRYVLAATVNPTGYKASGTRVRWSNTVSTGITAVTDQPFAPIW